MRLVLLSLSAALFVSPCNVDFSKGDQEAADSGSKVATSDPLASHDLKIGERLPAELADDKPRQVMQQQVVLDRLGFTPGVIDGKGGLSTANAINGFQEANGLPITGQIDAATAQALAQWNNIPATRVVTIPDTFAAGPFSPIPANAAEQAKLPGLGYESLDEKLAERFHTTVETLQELNPELTQTAGAPTVSAAGQAMPTAATPLFRAGQQVRVPNTGADKIEAGAVKNAQWQETLVALGVGTPGLQAARIVVSKSNGTLKAYNAADKLIGIYTATMGSRRDPLPLGEWKITGVAYNPPFSYNPKLFWDVPDSHEKQLLPPGPNGPVGVAWIDLSKEHYGIHGTPEPQTIGSAESHGCVRLTNWDVARLSEMVSSKTRVLFEA